MGYYIEVPENFNKARQIVQLYGGKILDKAPSWGEVSPNEAIICVFHNPNFDAAGFAFNPQELAYFKSPDSRQKTWLIMNRKKAEELTGFGVF